MEKINWAEVEEAKDYERVTAGGYVCRIVKVEDVPQKQYLRVYADVIEGEFANIGFNQQNRTGQDWGFIQFIRSYKPTARGFFKQLLSALEKSNNGRFTANTFDGNESKMVMMQLGLVLGEEEYLTQKGEKRIRTYVKDLTTPEAIRKGDFKVPALKMLPEEKQAAVPVAANECPF